MSIDGEISFLVSSQKYREIIDHLVAVRDFTLTTNLKVKAYRLPDWLISSLLWVSPVSEKINGGRSVNHVPFTREAPYMLFH